MNLFDHIDPDLSTVMYGKKFLVTGGCGSVGSTICRLLDAYKADTVILDNLSAYPFDYYTRYGTSCLKHCKFVFGDVLDERLIKELMEDREIVIHAAALADVAMGIDDPTKELNENILATHNLLMAARNSFLKKVVFVSSASIYGNQLDDNGKRIFSEDMMPRPVSNYGVSKLWGENQARVFYLLYGLPTVSLRYFSVYGAPQIPKRGSQSWAVAIFSWQALSGHPITIYGDGKQIRDFTHVTDIAEATIRAAINEKAVGVEINIGTGIATSIVDVAATIKEHLSDANIDYLDRRGGDPLGGVANTERASRLLGWSAKVTFKEGVKHYIKWLENNQDLLSHLSFS